MYIYIYMFYSGGKNCQSEVSPLSLQATLALLAGMRKQGQELGKPGVHNGTSFGSVGFTVVGFNSIPQHLAPFLGNFYEI